MLESITIVDWIIAVVIVVSTLISLKRGFVKEALSLVVLVAAMIISRMFGAQVATLLVDHITVPSLRLAAAYAGLFAATMVVGGLMNYLIVQVIRAAGLGGMDRLLGMIFGFARGALIIVIAVGFASKLPVSEDAWWQQSIAIPHFASMADTLQLFVSENADELMERAGILEQDGPLDDTLDGKQEGTQESTMEGNKDLNNEGRGV